jgi:hypothetical protein
MPDTCTITCLCGWSEEFSSSYAGLQIECPKCGKGHRVAMFGAQDTTVDMSTLDHLLGREAPVSVRFRPLLLVSLALALIVSAIALPLLWNSWPVNLAVVGGALSWPVAVALAWFGQARHLRRAKRLAASAN